MNVSYSVLTRNIQAKILYHFSISLTKCLCLDLNYGKNNSALSLKTEIVIIIFSDFGYFKFIELV